MRKPYRIIAAFAFLAGTLGAQAQWLTNGTSAYYNAGNVGIGTSTPTRKLEVHGDVGILGSPAILRTASNFDSDGLTFLGTKLILGAINSRAYSYTGNAVLYVGGFGDAQELMRINSNTNLGALTVTQATVDSLKFAIANNTGNKFVVEGDGRTGVGVTSPAARFVVGNGSGSELFRVQDDGSTNFGWVNACCGARVQIAAPNADPAAGAGNPAAYRGLVLSNLLDATMVLRTLPNSVSQIATDVAGRSLSFASGGFVEAMRIDPSQRVGIGTSAPASKLHVIGGGAGSLDVRTNGRIQTGDANNFGGIFLDYVQSGFVGQYTGDPHHFGFWVSNGTTTSWPILMNKQNGNVAIGGGLPVANKKLQVSGDAHVAGTLTATTLLATYQDLAEWVPAVADLEAGTVVVLSPERPNEVMAAAGAYDTRVAGVVSSQPGITLGEAGPAKEMIATTGRVRVKVDASAGPIRIGDLLVTSEVPGMAMKSEPMEIRGRKFHQPGTILGKALEPLDAGKGKILVLLSLQ